MFDFIASDNNDKKNTVLWLKFYFSKKNEKHLFHTINLTVSFGNSFTNRKQIKRKRFFLINYYLLKREEYIKKKTTNVYLLKKPQNPSDIQL